jgi:hypothetical protein
MVGDARTSKFACRDDAQLFMSRVFFFGWNSHDTCAVGAVLVSRAFVLYCSVASVAEQ